MSSPQNYYSLLQVKPNADLDTIKRAYRSQIRRYHPDQFAAKLARLKSNGSPSEIKYFEREITRAQQMTQRINEAYAVLSDETRRASYDEKLSAERQRQYNHEVQMQRRRHWEDGRRTVKSRPHNANPNTKQAPKQEGIPWFILLGLIGLLFLVSTLFSNAVTQNYTPFTTYVPSNPTSPGSVLAIDLQATASSEQATYVARSTIVYDASPTPRSSSDNERSADIMMRYGQIINAINLYNMAIEIDEQNATLYFKRGIAYNQLVDEGDDEYIDEAIADYGRAILYNPDMAEAYLGRGMLYYDLWRTHDDFAEDARADLEAYVNLTDTDTTIVNALLNDLP
ncbi:MAG: DnaJ domain-containing protein [Chloroflexota bacterium]